MEGTGNGTLGIDQVPTGWFNASVNGGTPDMSNTDAYAGIIPAWWNVSETDVTRIILPPAPTGASVFPSVATGIGPTQFIENISTNINNLTISETYIIPVYLLAAVSAFAEGGDAVYYPTSIDVVIAGDTTVIPIDATLHNNWKLFNLTFVANSNSVLFQIGNCRPQPTDPSGGGGMVCIAVAPNSVVLPLNFGEIKVSNNDCINTVSFNTFNELNTKSFYLESSQDESNWQPIGKFNSKGPGDNAYSYIDKSPVNSINYYRIREEDIDGDTSYSKIVYSKMSCDRNISITVYPNPVSDYAKVAIAGVGYYNASLYNADGKKLWSGIFHAGINNLNLSMLHDNRYFLRIVYNKSDMIEKIIVKH